ncbi:MAG TPA: multicopper oxidase domain-containing protein, partial [Minicystis sp.]|nr:multicopper oxidase domain-containing protein [Minicystis sp.]
MNRREALGWSAALFAGAATWIGRRGDAAAEEPKAAPGPYTPVTTPNGKTLPWKMVGGVKEFHLVAEPVKREFAPGMVVDCWGYNGQAPGPTIEAVDGDRVRFVVTNKLPERTSVHWH